ncbi:hypothetical protein Bpfe_022692 [Biomphalaria pfeifferi]|uniref:Uncharacterized protein n=1 Tax=Biomphalaria pfeifferi TaxID=112525 RepID=A0AAD8B4H9_BIOPF|nr:hypothetical protein Bpfe_022692 [Biomphalaria pfeifferi]
MPSLTLTPPQTGKRLEAARSKVFLHALKLNHLYSGNNCHCGTRELLITFPSSAMSAVAHKRLSSLNLVEEH